MGGWVGWLPELRFMFRSKKLTYKVAALKALSSIGLGFLNPTSQIKCTDVIAFCMQLRNSGDR